MAGRLITDLETADSQHRALLDKVTLVNALRFPLMALLPKGPMVKNVLYEWPLDQYEQPTDNAVVDGTDVSQFDNASEDLAIVQNRMQWMRDSAMVSKLTQDVSDEAGVKDQRAYAIKKKLEKLWRDIEAALGSDNEAVVGTSSAGNKMRGLGTWIQNGAQTVYPVPEDYRTPSASVYSSALTSFTESSLSTVLKSIWTEVGPGERYVGICGGDLKQRISDSFTKVSSGGTDVYSTIRTFDQKADAKKITSTIDRYEGDFINLELISSHWLGYNFSTSAANAKRGYILDTKEVDVVWKQLPKVMPLPDNGGGPRFCVDAIVGNRCYNPKALGKIAAS